MDAMEAILSRRSIRKYTTRPVPETVVKELLAAAMAAPSAGNEQTWHFIVIDDRQILNEITKYHHFAQMLKEAPCAIVVCGDAKLEMYKGLWVQDCSAATENLLIAAQAKGLGAVWLGIYPIMKRIAATQELLGLPENVIPLCLIAIGYPAEEKLPANRYNPSRVRYNRW